MNCELCHREPRVTQRLCSTCSEMIRRLALSQMLMRRRRSSPGTKETVVKAQPTSSNSKKSLLPFGGRSRARNSRELFSKSVDHPFDFGE